MQRDLLVLWMNDFDIKNYRWPAVTGQMCSACQHRFVRPSCGHISKTKQDRPIFTKEQYTEVGTANSIAGLTLRGALCQHEMGALLIPSFPFPSLFPLPFPSLPLEVGPLKYS